MTVRRPSQSAKEERSPDREQSFATSLDSGGQFLFEGADCVVVLDTWATANLVGFERATADVRAPPSSIWGHSRQWLAHHNRILDRKGLPGVPTYPASARCKFGDGRLGGGRHAADVPVGIADNRGKCAALVLEADIPALPRKGDLGAIGGQWDFSR